MPLLPLKKWLGRTMLPRRRLILWWLAAMVLWSTVVWSVQELPNDQMMLSPEKQRLEPGFDEDPSGEETRLLEKLQARFKELEEREHTLQQREERVAALQRDLEALAARQTKDKQQLEEQASSLAAEQRRY